MVIKENFFHFIWRLQYFYKNQLTTTDGETLTILQPGNYNTDAGPDFSNARIKIGSMEWIGNIEIHVRSSDWRLHHHQNNDAYDNIILHVVYSDDEPVKRKDGSTIPTLELKNRLEDKMLQKYSSVITNNSPIPCTAHLNYVSEIIKSSMIQKAVTDRLINKYHSVSELLVRNNGDWQETNYQWLAKNLGFKINADPLLRLAKATPLKVLWKHRNNQMQVEALLFGQAGFLEGEEIDDYHKLLKREYDFLAHKYSMSTYKMNLAEWKFLRIRPANFPSIRIAQLAAIITHLPEIFTDLLEFQSIKELKGKLSTCFVSSYWKSHYKFGEPAEMKLKSFIGNDSIDNLMINSVSVLLFAMGVEKDNEDFKEKSLELLEAIPTESNKIIKEWEDAGLKCKSAFDSQAAIQLYNNYCNEKRCLDCEIGASILKEEFSEYRKEELRSTIDE